MTDQLQKYKAIKKANETLKKRGNRKYIAIAVALLAVVVLVGYSEYIAELIPFGGVHTYSVGGSAERKSKTMTDTVIVCNKNGITGISRSGREKWYIKEPLDKPLISAEKNKAAVSSLKSRTVYAISEDGKYNKILTEESVLNVKTNRRGDVVVIMDKQPYHGGAAVYDEKGSNVFTWWSGKGSLTDVALSDDGKTLAAAVLTRENNALKSSIIYFDVYGRKEKKTVLNCDGELISALSFKGGKLVAVSDAKTRILSASGETKSEINYEGGVLNLFDISEKGNLVFVTGSSSLDRNQTVSSYSAGGRLIGSFKFEGEINGISTNKGRIVITSGKNVVMSNRKGTRQKTKICDTDVYECSIFKFGNRIYLDEGDVAKLQFVR